MNSLFLLFVYSFIHSTDFMENLLCRPGYYNKNWEDNRGHKYLFYLLHEITKIKRLIYKNS